MVLIQKLFQINQDDLETYLRIKEDVDLQSEIKVLSDPTLKITSGEGVKGYNALFSSRFNKLKRIISDRPESIKLKSLASVKTVKFDDDLYVCGLVTSKNSVCGRSHYNLLLYACRVCLLLVVVVLVLPVAIVAQVGVLAVCFESPGHELDTCS